MVPLANFFVFIGLQWWAFWYPGAEPGGGGYIAQRIFSARDEKQGLLSVLWFNIAHYAIRPWPWILTGVAVIVLYPGLAHPETGYMLVLNNYLPHQYRGIAIAGFLAAFMSTIATQLNWGASYLVSDFYRRFVNKSASESHYVLVSRLSTVLLVIAAAYISVQLGSIASGWEIVLQVGAGTGAVYILRWYWWRINAWSEISAMACIAGHQPGAQPLASLQRQRLASIRQGRDHNDHRNDDGLGHGHAAHQARAGRSADPFLPQRASRRSRLAAGGETASRYSRKPRPWRQPVGVAAGLRHGVHLPVRYGEDSAAPTGDRDRVVNRVGRVRFSSVSPRGTQFCCGIPGARRQRARLGGDARDNRALVLMANLLLSACGCLRLTQG